MLHFIKYILIILLTLNTSLLFSFDLKGIVTDINKKPLSNANIYIQNSNISTITNKDGNFLISLPPGNYTVVCKLVGFKTEQQQVLIENHATNITFTLSELAIELPEVEIVELKEDPANQIIRAAIKKRQEIEKENFSFSTKAYTKANQRLLDAPEKFMGFNISALASEMGLDSNRRGIIYLSESESILFIDPPDKYKEQIISSKIAGESQGFTFNQAAKLIINPYQNIIDFGEIIPRGIVSPISDNAFSYYRYYFEGSFFSENKIINKIAIYPKNERDPAFRGYIYIIEDEWIIYSTDFIVTQKTQLKFFENLKIKQSYFPVQNKWMLASQELSFSGRILTFAFEGDIINTYTDYKLNLDLPKKFFRGEVLSINKDSNKKDNEYWNSIRPVPLSVSEIKDYQKKDSLESVRSEKKYLDSMDNIYNKIKPWTLLVGGPTITQRSKNKTIHISPLFPDNLQFNSVEGFNLTFKSTHIKELKDYKTFTLIPEIHYGFSSKDLTGNLAAYYKYDPIKNASIGIRGGSEITDFNNRGSINYLFNTFNNLFNQQNYLKLYKRTFITFSHTQELTPGIKIEGVIDYSDRIPLNNSTYFSFNEDNSDNLTANNPYYGEGNDLAFEQHQALTILASTTFSPLATYETRPEGRYYHSSGYPKFNITYKAGIPILGSDVNYNQISAKMYDIGKNIGLLGSISYSLTGGTFLSKKEIYYQDYQHFRGNRLDFYEGSSYDVFRFLDYYEHSTDGAWLEAHFEHNLKGMLFHRIPFLRAFKLEEVWGVSYLKTSELKNYYEAYVGIQKLFFRCEYGFSRMNSEAYMQGFRFSVSF